MKGRGGTSDGASERPLGGEGGIEEEGAGAGGVGVIDEVVAQLPLGAEAEVAVEVVPQLGLGEDDQAAVAVGFLAAPEVDEACEGQLLAAQLQPPHARQLGAGIGMGGVVALEVLFVEQLEAPGLGEILVMPVPGSTHEGGLLEAARAAQSAVVFHMGGKGRLLA